jgi:hypothetical protein
MSKQPWSQNTVARGVAAVLFATTLLVATEAGAHPTSNSVVRGPGHQVATFGGAGERLQTDELDPTDDGSIIIECVVLAGQAAPHANGPRSDLSIRAIAVPQFPLGPSTCSPKEHKRA